MDTTTTTPRLQPECDGGVLMQRPVRERASDKSVRDLTVKVKVKDGQIIAEQATCGIVFSFPAAVWPKEASKQWQWIERLTPWWDMWIPHWTPQAQRLRESCVKAINKLFEDGAAARKPRASFSGASLRTMHAGTMGRYRKSMSPVN